MQDELPPIDHHLVSRVEARASGADAHSVYTLIALYYASRQLIAHQPGYRQAFFEQERRLRAFTVTGRIEHAAALAA